MSKPIFQKIKSLVESEQIHWIGLEESPEEFNGSANTPSFTQRIEELQDYYSNDFFRRLSHIMPILFENISVAYVEDPITFAQISIVPLEDYSLRIEVGDMGDKISAELTRLLRFSQQKVQEGTMTLKQYDVLSKFIEDMVLEIESVITGKRGIFNFK